MSYLYSYQNSYAGKTDTENILASVKEQELQFEKLTRQLEEEHNTVVHQIEKYKIDSDQDKDIIKSEHEESDTESRRDSTNGQKFSKASLNDQVYQKHPVPNRSSRSSSMIQHRLSPSKTKHHPDDIYEQSHHLSYVQSRQRPRSLAPVEDLESPVFQTYFIPNPARPVASYHKPSGFIYPNSPLNSSSSPTKDVPSGFYPYPFEKPVSPLVYPNQPYSGYSFMYPYVSQSIPNQYHHMLQQHRPHSNHTQFFYDTSTNLPPYDFYSPVHSPRYEHAPPVPPRDTPYHQSHMHRDAGYHVKPTPHRASFRLPKSIYAGFPLADQPTYRNQVHRSTFQNIQSPLHYSSPHAESTPVYDQRSKPNQSKSKRISSSETRALSPRSSKSSSMHPTTDAHLDVSLASGGVEIVEVVKKLKHPSYHVVANAAAYIQHLTFGDDEMKTLIRDQGVLPILINLLHHHVLDVQRSACGALRNLVFGKKNNESKLAVKNCGGIASLAHVLRTTNDQDMKELISGVLWNLSSCDGIKMAIADSAMSVLASRILIYYVSMLDPERMSRYHPDDFPDSSSHNLTRSDLTIDPLWSNTFTNATGCLRNISSAGVEVRTKMRFFDGLIESLLLVVEHVIGKNDVDSKGVENCMCILRNLSYRLAVEVDAANTPIPKDDEESEGCGKDDDCWGRYRIKRKKRPRNVEVLFSVSSRSPSQISLHSVELLWQPGVVRRYLALLAETCNSGTLEAASGALQNLSAGRWIWSANIRTAVRKEKGLPMLVEFLHMDNLRVVTVMCSTLRNMALDERNKQLIGKHAIGDFVELLPEAESISSVEAAQKEAENDSPVLSFQKVLLYEAVCCALKELVTSNIENANFLYNSGAVSKLIEISRGGGYRYPHRIVKAAGRVLAVLWDYKNLRSLFKQQGWTQFHFNMPGVPSIASAGSQVSPFSSPPLSPTDSSKETNIFSPSPNKVLVPSSTHRELRSSPNQPLIPSRPLFTSPQPDANYVMLHASENKQHLAESLV